jgi:hypothetical protein
MKTDIGGGVTLRHSRQAVREALLSICLKAGCKDHNLC